MNSKIVSLPVGDEIEQGDLVFIKNGLAYPLITDEERKNRKSRNDLINKLFWMSLHGRINAFLQDYNFSEFWR
jgi:hypothetical protein